MEKAKNYIFDLYGTLIDIWTDERDPALWNGISAFYSVYGADWSPEVFERSYLQFVHEAEESLRREKGYAFPEIELLDVFRRLWREAPKSHSSGYSVSEDNLEDFLIAAANLFRILSRRRLGLYPNTLRALHSLRAEGRRLWLLSNAQHCFTLPEMEALGLAGLFDGIYISSDCGMKKPQPEFMKKLLCENGIDPGDAVMVGNDFSSDMRIAAECGVKGIFLNTDRYDADTLLREKKKLYPAEIELIPSGDIIEIL